LIIGIWEPNASSKIKQLLKLTENQANYCQPDNPDY